MLIAVAQYRLAKATYRHDLYERQSAVYKATMKFIAQVTSGGNAKLDDLQTFLRHTCEAAFHTTNKLLESRLETQTQREQLADKMHDLLLWFGEHFAECRRLFAKDLSLV